VPVPKLNLAQTLSNLRRSRFFILVDPDHNFESGGAIQREVIERDRKSGEIIKIGRVRGVCVNCAKAMIRLECWRDPFANTCHCMQL
jgi:hypothetical protein